MFSFYHSSCLISEQILKKKKKWKVYYIIFLLKIRSAESIAYILESMKYFFILLSANNELGAFDMLLKLSELHFLLIT